MPGDILVVEGNGSLEHIGRNALFNGEIQNCIHQNHVIRVRIAPDQAVPSFIARFLNSPQGRRQMVQRAETTSGLYTLSTGKVASLEVPTPSISEQQSIATRLTEQAGVAESLRAATAEHLETICALPAALLREAFTGAI